MKKLWILALLALSGCLASPSQVAGRDCQFSRYLIVCCDQGECTYTATEPTVPRALRDAIRNEVRRIEESNDD